MVDQLFKHKKIVPEYFQKRFLHMMQMQRCEIWTNESPLCERYNLLKQTQSLMAL